MIYVPRLLPYLLFSLVIAFAISIFPTIISGYTDTVETTVQISVCGNFVTEGGEECDNTDTPTCEALHYESGTTSCDESCSLNTTACVPFPTPTPSPSPSPSPSPVPTPSPIPSPSSTESPTTTPVPSSSGSSNTSLPPAPTTVSFEELRSPFFFNLPNLSIHDSSDAIVQVVKERLQAAFGITKVTNQNLAEVVGKWVNAWRGIDKKDSLIADKGNTDSPQSHSSCDLNNDLQCNIVDFSVLMYSVGK